MNSMDCKRTITLFTNGTGWRSVHSCWRNDAGRVRAFYQATDSAFPSGIFGNSMKCTRRPYSLVFVFIAVNAVLSPDVVALFERSVRLQMY